MQVAQLAHFVIKLSLLIIFLVLMGDSIRQLLAKEIGTKSYKAEIDPTQNFPSVLLCPRKYNNETIHVSAGIHNFSEIERLPSIMDHVIVDLVKVDKSTMKV